MGTQFFQQYLSDPRQNNLAFLKRVLEEYNIDINKKFSVIHNDNIRIRYLENDNSLLIIMNYDIISDIEFEFRIDGVLSNISNSSKITVDMNETHSIIVGENEILLLNYSYD